MNSTLVFVHGAGCTADIFAAQVAAFPNSIAVTLPGHTTPGAPSTIAEFTEAVLAEIERRAVQDVVIAGSSMGGAIALELALRHDRRIAGVVLIGSGARLRVAPAVFEAMHDDFSTAARTLASKFFADPQPARVEAAAVMMERVGAPQTERDFRACDAFDVTARLSEIDVPLLAITGEDDVMTPPKYATFLADRVPGATARILPAAGHLAMIERPAETNDALRAFVIDTSVNFLR